MITRTRLTCPAYEGAIRPLVSSLGEGGEVYLKDISEGLTVLRATLMNPFSVAANPAYLAGLTDAVRRVAMRFLRDQSAIGQPVQGNHHIIGSSHLTLRLATGS